VYEPQPANLLENRNNFQQRVKPPIPYIQNKIEEAEALLSLIDASLDELNQPMTAVLCWTKLLLSETDSNNPLATDLSIIAQQVSHMSEVLKGLNLLMRYRSSPPVDPAEIKNIEPRNLNRLELK
jgi:signal transduction histidine kinase